jgi:hypothetical protein
MKQLNKTAYNFSVSLILIPFFIILNFLDKKESEVICMREFEIILLQTQSLLILYTLPYRKYLMACVLTVFPFFYWSVLMAYVFSDYSGTVN